MTTETASAALLAALVEEAAKKSGLVWVDGQALWHAWADGALCLVGGPGEQRLPPGVTDGGSVTVTARSKDKGGRLVTWPAGVALLAPGSASWSAATAELKSKRLNSPDGEGLAGRWARECRVFRLTAAGPPSEHPGAVPTASGAAAPVPTPATTRHPAPAALPRLLTRRRSQR
ncbi:hypothetical protein [Actinacidiphila sp. ITFR-21]|uniref:hypothetical protein n=1 Tax=Actinacidiphila sp. ITFR-21 TaxID=3075199 RepID=UPI00288BFE2F|nr:hypothetical protein [Streptomyces sp. ITFR-21]WNI17860.1 hypothetical protein RLT57_21475 [Streptomyces sp. ITFR-21]